MNFKFDRPRLDKIPRDKIIKELEDAAKVFDYITFGKRDFNKVANINYATVIRHFGSWNKAIEFLKEHLKRNNKELLPRRQKYFSEKALFDEMERVWILIGHRPSKTEWFASNPKYSYATYRRYFNGWTNACLKFIEYKMGGEILTDSSKLKHNSFQTKQHKRRIEINTEDTRTIPLGIRLKVLNRDKFRCVFCGRSPAINIGVQLHIDHKVPFSEGGKSILENLQTLCFECNLGKSNKKI